MFFGGFVLTFMCDCMSTFFSIMARSFSSRCGFFFVGAGFVCFDCFALFEVFDRVRVWRSGVDSVFVSKFGCDVLIRFVE